MKFVATTVLLLLLTACGADSKEEVPTETSTSSTLDEAKIRAEAATALKRYEAWKAARDLERLAEYIDIRETGG